MRTLSGILFTVGIPWALIAWMAVCGRPAGALEDLRTALTHHEMLLEAILQIPGLLLLSALAASGYIIWANWLLIASGKRFRSRRFWFLASMHHLAWVLLAAPWSARYTMPLTVAIFRYSMAVLVCCIVAGLLAGDGRASVSSQGKGAGTPGYNLG